MCCSPMNPRRGGGGFNCEQDKSLDGCESLYSTGLGCGSVGQSGAAGWMGGGLMGAPRGGVEGAGAGWNGVGESLVMQGLGGSKRSW